MPTSEPPSSHEQATESDSLTTTIAIAILPPNALEVHIRPAFRQFDEVERIFVHLGGSRADVVFADIDSVKRTSQAYAERPLRAREREFVFPKHENHGG
jgi:hypothetical protein